MGGRVARFDADGDDPGRSDGPGAESAPASQARLDAVGAAEEPAAAVATFAGLASAPGGSPTAADPTGADPAADPTAADPTGTGPARAVPAGAGQHGSGPGTDGAGSGPDDRAPDAVPEDAVPEDAGLEGTGVEGTGRARPGAAAVARLGDALDAPPAARVAGLQVPEVAPSAAPRTARFGEGGRSGSPSRRGARGGTARARREAPGTSGSAARRARRDRADAAETIDPGVPPTDDGPSGAAAAETPRRGWGPKQIDPDADPLVAAREICLRLLTDRARTRHELAQALRQRGVPDEAAESVLSRFDEVGLIDDAAFAGQYVRSRHTYRGLSRRAIAMELRRKGVDDEVAGEALEEVDPESEEQRARELVDRKLRTVPADTPEQRTKAANRLVGMLARRGYGGGIAYRVVREALAAHGAEIDELGEG